MYIWVHAYCVLLRLRTWFKSQVLSRQISDSLLPFPSLTITVTDEYGKPFIESTALFEYYQIFAKRSLSAQKSSKLKECKKARKLERK